MSIQRRITIASHAAAVIFLLFVCTHCEDKTEPKISPERSDLKLATDVFWALNDNGYVIAATKPVPSQHGCEPNEYIAEKNKARFRISVYDCKTFEKALRVVTHPKTQHVDELLRNHDEGGILQRGPLEIIVRMTEGKGEDAHALIDLLGQL